MLIYSVTSVRKLLETTGTLELLRNKNMTVYSPFQMLICVLCVSARTYKYTCLWEFMYVHAQKRREHIPDSSTSSAFMVASRADICSTSFLAFAVFPLGKGGREDLTLCVLQLSIWHWSVEVINMEEKTGSELLMFGSSFPYYWCQLNDTTPRCSYWITVPELF